MDSRKINSILNDNLEIIVDTREKENKHILQFFQNHNVKYEKEKLDTGDYAARLINTESGFIFPAVVERKASVNEIIGNMLEKKDENRRLRIEREFERAANCNRDVYMIVEEENGLNNISSGKYRSELNCKAALGKFLTWNAMYTKGTTFCSKANTGFYIYKILYYAARNYMKWGFIDGYDSDKQN